jgi:hypothetical protein
VQSYPNGGESGKVGTEGVTYSDVSRDFHRHFLP